ncbi:hypothetical protein [Deinococcus kurensis]|uniref:hypothetical protein n=1 Tax=Deinococcus kurensis TaxID=2662757 RepID=UPI0012D31D17|nr:hypothetical protein [Deinococcus kurensis]
MSVPYVTLTPDERGAAQRFLAALAAALDERAGEALPDGTPPAVVKAQMMTTAAMLWAQGRATQKLTLALRHRPHLLPREAQELAFTVTTVVWDGVPRLPIRDLDVAADDLWVLRCVVDRVRAEVGPLQGEELWGPLPQLGGLRVQTQAAELRLTDGEREHLGAFLGVVGPVFEKGGGPALRPARQAMADLAFWLTLDQPVTGEVAGYLRDALGPMDGPLWTALGMMMRTRGQELDPQMRPTLEGLLGRVGGLCGQAAQVKAVQA